MHKTGLKAYYPTVSRIFETKQLKIEREEIGESNRVNNLTQQTRLIQSCSKQVKIRSFLSTISRVFTTLCAERKERRMRAKRSLEFNCLPSKKIFSRSSACFFILKKTFAKNNNNIVINQQRKQMWRW